MRRLFLKLFRRGKLQQDLEAELAFHREMAAAQGNPIPFGNAAAITESALDLWRFTILENLWRDVVYGIRSLRRSPPLVFSALLSLALGIGANTAMFSLGVELLFSEPSVSGPGSLVSIRLGGSSSSKPKVLDFVRDSGVFQEVAGENEESFINWNNGAETRRIFGVYTSKNYFTALGVPMAYGRGIVPGDPDEVVVLRHLFWRRHYNSDPSIVGRAINLNGRACTVVGILPAAHRTLLGFGFSPDIYLPRYLEETQLSIYARLKPGMSIGEARAGLKTVAQRLDETFQERWKYVSNLSVSPIAGFARVKSEPQIQTIGVFFALLLAVSGLVLLIACVNVASLLLARASVRRREIAIRLALGAGRGRLLQQLLVESLLLSLLGAGFGLALAQVVATLLARVNLPLPLPIRIQIEPNWRIALYAAFLTMLATLACGMLPAWQSVKESIARDFQRESKFRLRRILVTAQIAISLVVLATGFLFLRNLFESNAISPGFDVRHTLRADVNLPPVTYKDVRRKGLYVEQALRDLQALPGIEAAAAARIIPFTGNTVYGSRLTFPDSGERVQAAFRWNAVTPGYFRTLDIPVRQGRTFSSADRGASKVVVVNQTFVERYLGARRPAGTTFLWEPVGTTYEIIGVVEGTKNLSIGEDPQPQLYQPLAQIDDDRPGIQFVLRSATPPVTQLDAVRIALRRVEPGAGVEVATLYSSIGLAFLPSQVGAALLGSIGILGLLLAAIGLYGVMVYSVARRTREIGVRMAIGASRGDISRMILLDSAKLIGAGSAFGLFIAFFVTKPLAMFLVPGLKPADPLSFLTVLLVLVLTGLLATWGPVRRALAIDPMSSLRYE
jgi:putative ABC transport system permease protein